MMSEADDRVWHATHSSFREMVVEHRVLADLLSLALRDHRLIEVSRAESDQFGYDLVLTERGVTRHVQIKSSLKDGKARFQTINTALVSKPSPCVLWVIVQDTPLGLSTDHYLFFGGRPGEPMPDLGDKVGHQSAQQDSASWN